MDMPLFFFIDKDIVDDPSARNVTDVVLSYTFFKYELTPLYPAIFSSLPPRARRNEQGHLVPDAPLNVVEASLGFDKYEHVLAKDKATKPS